MKLKVNTGTPKVAKCKDDLKPGKLYQDADGDLVVVDEDGQREINEGAVVFIMDSLNSGFAHYDRDELDGLSYPLTPIKSITIKA